MMTLKCRRFSSVGAAVIPGTVRVHSPRQPLATPRAFIWGGWARAAPARGAGRREVRHALAGEREGRGSHAPPSPCRTGRASCDAPGSFCRVSVSCAPATPATRAHPASKPSVMSSYSQPGPFENGLACRPTPTQPHARVPTHGTQAQRHIERGVEPIEPDQGTRRTRATPRQQPSNHAYKPNHRARMKTRGDPGPPPLIASASAPSSPRPRRPPTVPPTRHPLRTTDRSRWRSLP